MTKKEKIKLQEYYLNELCRLNDDIIVCYNALFVSQQNRRKNDGLSIEPYFIYNLFHAIVKYNTFRETMHNTFELLGMLKF